MMERKLFSILEKEQTKKKKMFCRKNYEPRLWKLGRVICTRDLSNAKEKFGVRREGWNGKIVPGMELFQRLSNIRFWGFFGQSFEHRYVQRTKSSAPVSESLPSSDWLIIGQLTSFFFFFFFLKLRLQLYFFRTRTEPKWKTYFL